MVKCIKCGRDLPATDDYWVTVVSLPDVPIGHYCGRCYSLTRTASQDVLGTNRYSKHEQDMGNRTEESPDEHPPTHNLD